MASHHDDSVRPYAKTAWGSIPKPSPEKHVSLRPTVEFSASIPLASSVLLTPRRPRALSDYRTTTGGGSMHHRAQDRVSSFVGKKNPLWESG